MTKRIPRLLLAACLLSGLNAGAQRTCASHSHLQHQLSQHPEMARQRGQLEETTRNYVMSRSGAARQKGTAAIYNIPVVVHVLYNNSSQNISDAQIQSQLDVLNKDYQLLNTDAGLVPAAFSGLKADCQISFCLAKRSPSGDSTTGIIRKFTNKILFDADLDQAKYSSTGGNEAWPTDQYLNIWVVPNIVSYGVTGIMGYAQFPGGPAITDGVVIAYNYFGATGTVSAPYNKGRTTTHEVGHWLNLNHIWGDDGGLCSGDDGVGDTPNQGAETYGCPSFPMVSCNNGPNGDMFMNYMDYTDDGCMNMFTTGQKSRMHALFAAIGPRASLLTSQGCTAPGTTVCNAPIGLAVAGTSSSATTLSWSAVTGATAYKLQWKAASATTWNTVSGLTATSYALSGLPAATNYQFQVETVCGNTPSGYSPAATFTTLTACTNSYEPNESNTAAPVIPVNTPLYSRIATGTDKDYYKFTTSSSNPKVKVTLTGLPANYDLKLLKSNGSTAIATSAKTGTLAESIVYNATVAGTYFVYVYPKDKNQFKADLCYELLVQTGIANFRGTNTGRRDDDHEGNDDNDNNDDQGENRLAAPAASRLFPNPAKGTVHYELQAAADHTGYMIITDMSGRKSLTLPIALKQGTNRASADISSLPAGLYYVRLVTVEGSRTIKLLIEK